ncbi:hypothetical protein BDM02DRAFT_1732786 [Thelephora ganbajun]|uniref:Uncharacterized protein n=1 Tax=Thelephora ganbajun TaxID=370292 RepID=A0ACB6ZJC5_THEGA|nr:hypothetical protein BDM02DRAFT_1732786 [Thelephora ganbajun]
MAEPTQAEALRLGAKKRKLQQQACDICRRRKVRCDGPYKPTTKCTNCITGKLNCTYAKPKARRAPKQSAETLDTRLDKMERMLSNAFAEGDYNIDQQSKSSPTSFPITTPAPPFPYLTPSVAPEVDEDGLSSSDEEAGAVPLVYDMQKLALDSTHQRFFGKSSSAALFTAARDIKKKYAEIHHYGDLPKTFGIQRPQSWIAQPWVRAKIQTAKNKYEFPEQDLLWLLIDKYFICVNAFLPLLHRPTFESDIADGLHLRNGGFGGVVLLVCALGSRHLDDPRVLLPGTSDLASAGWAWFDQVQVIRNSFLAPAGIHEIQSHSLAASYLMGCSSPQACWIIVGTGLRLIQDVGVHRKKVYKPNLTVSDELWKRAFWCLVYQDRINSVTLGRSPALNDEDFDLDLPADCDDEYWAPTNGGVPFKQPPGIPSTITFFNLSHGLNQIVSFAMRTIYSINRSKVLFGYVGPQWEQTTVAQLDSALNKWVDSIPDYLRWDPSRENGLFFDQSAILYAHYYQTQILIHRPFIPKPDKPSLLSFPSLAICANAARSCSHIIDLQKRRGSRALYLNSMPAFCAGIVLLVNMWGAKKARVKFDHTREMGDVHKCMEALLACETLYHFTGRFWDILRDLAEVGSFPESHASPSESTNKRVYGFDEPTDFPPPDNMPKASQNGRGPIAGSRRVSLSLNSTGRGASSVVNSANVLSPTLTTTPGTQYIRGDLSVLSMAGSTPTPEKTDGLETSSYSSPTLTRVFDGNAIPITTNDLGRLPLHHGVKFPTNFNFGEIANGWNTSGSGRASTTLGDVQQSYGLGRGVDSMDTQTRAIPGLHLPQEQHPEDLFPWMPYTMTIGAGETTTDSIPTLTTVANTIEPNVASTYVSADPNQTQQATDRLDSTISSLFGDVPSTSSTALGQTMGLLPGPTSDSAEVNADLFGALFPPSDPPVGMDEPPTVQTTQQPHDEQEERGFGNLPPVNAQAYLRGWSNAPQAFE